MGRRVVVRCAVPGDEPGRLAFADTVGDLLDLDSDTALIDASGDPVWMPLFQVAHARLVEPSTADILALERTCARGWRAAETAELGGWTLRANGGFTGRANSVLPGRQLDRPLDDALAAARVWYAERGLPLRMQVPLPARRLLDGGLDQRGWPVQVDVQVLVARLDVLQARAAPATAVDPVDIDERPDDAWLAVVRDGTLPPTARDLLLRHERVAFARVRLDGRTVAVGRGAVDDGWLGITLVEVVPGHRRQGLATALMAALWRWGSAQSATRSYLQVATTNEPALRLYTGLGYWHHHDYRYRLDPASTG